MYPYRDTLSYVPRSGYITARDQSMLESGVTEGGKNTAKPRHWLPVFFLANEVRWSESLKIIDKTI